MNQTNNQPQSEVLENIVKILNSRKLAHAELCAPLDIAESNVSKLLNGKTRLTYDMLTKIADYLSMNVIDIITWPDKYVPSTSSEAEPVEATLQIKLKKDKKDQVLKLVFGENNLEILNK